MDHFEDASTILSRKIELFKILVYERRLRHIELRNKVKITRGFDTGDILVIRKHVKSSIKDREYQGFVFKTNILYVVLDTGAPRSYWLHRLNFCEGLVMFGRKVKGSMERM